MNNLNNNAAKIAEFLLQINAVKLQPTKPFKWASGWNSPIYCDNRKILAYPEIRSFIKNEFVELIKEFEAPTCIAGVATGGIAIGALIAEELGLPFCYGRSSVKSHGMKNNIEYVFKTITTVEHIGPQWCGTGGEINFDAIEIYKKIRNNLELIPNKKIINMTKNGTLIFSFSNKNDIKNI